MYPVRQEGKRKKERSRNDWKNMQVTIWNILTWCSSAETENEANNEKWETSDYETKLTLDNAIIDIINSESGISENRIAACAVSFISLLSCTKRWEQLRPSLSATISHVRVIRTMMDDLLLIPNVRRHRDFHKNYYRILLRSKTSRRYRYVWHTATFSTAGFFHFSHSRISRDGVGRN